MRQSLTHENLTSNEEIEVKRSKCSVIDYLVCYNQSQSLLRQPSFANVFLSPTPLRPILMGLQIPPRPCYGQLLTRKINIGEEEEGINGAIFTFFFRKNLNKLWFIELSQNFCDWLSEPENIYWKGKPEALSEAFQVSSAQTQNSSLPINPKQWK